MNTDKYLPSETGLLLVDPYNDFLSEGGKEALHAAQHINGPTYATAILTTWGC